MGKVGYVYILTNKNHSVLYIGVTSKLKLRLHQHLTEYFPNSFTSRYNVKKLVYFEKFNLISEAISREKQIKAGSRMKKIELINAFNPNWDDLSSFIE